MDEGFKSMMRAVTRKSGNPPRLLNFSDLEDGSLGDLDGMAFGINYTDADRVESLHWVKVNTVDVNRTHPILKCYSYTDRAPRTFRVDRIRSVIDGNGQVEDAARVFVVVEDDGPDTLIEEHPEAAEPEETESIIGQVVLIRYVDANGECTPRFIRVLQYYDDISPRLYAMCMVRNEPEAFRIERIEELTDSDGLVWSPVDWLHMYGIEVDPAALVEDTGSDTLVKEPPPVAARREKVPPPPPVPEEVRRARAEDRARDETAAEAYQSAVLARVEAERENAEAARKLAAEPRPLSLRLRKVFWIVVAGIEGIFTLAGMAKGELWVAVALIMLLAMMFFPFALGFPRFFLPGVKRPTRWKALLIYPATIICAFAIANAMR